MGQRLRGFAKPRNESTLREPLPGHLPLKPSLAYKKYVALLFRDTLPRQGLAR